ncbi:MAG: hypothetical protein R3C99_06190 [Pirellulaceae bacterium]
MANYSFADRLGRARSMQAAIDSFSPAFDPADESLSATAFAAMLDELETMNAAVDQQLDQYKTGVDERKAMLKDLQLRAGRVLSLINSNQAWARYQRSVKSVVDKIRGNRPKSPKPPSGSESAAQTKNRRTGQRSFAEMESHLNRLTATLQKIADYDPPAPELSIAELQSLHTALSTKNLAMVDLDQELSMKQRDRAAAYDGERGLREQMKAIKAAVRAQYGSRSSEHAAVSGIRL